MATSPCFGKALLVGIFMISGGVFGKRYNILEAELEAGTNATKNGVRSAQGADSEDRLGNLWCPKGLTPLKESKQCKYLYEYENSKVPIVFETGGWIDVQSIFKRELTNAVNPAIFAKLALDELKEADHKAHEDHSAAAILKHLKHNAHEVAEDLKPIEFVAHHELEHVLLHSLVHALGHGAAGNVLAALAEALGNPMMIGLSAILAFVKSKLKDLNDEMESARLAGALMHKADCTGMKLGTLKYQGVDLQVRDLKNSTSACGPKAKKLLVEQIVKTNTQATKLFDELRRLGRCLYPLGEPGPKTRCMRKVMPAIHKSGDHMGILMSSIMMTAVYTQTLDNLIEGTSRSGYLKSIWHVFFEEAGFAQKEPDGVVHQTNEGRALSCAQLHASQVAFQHVFLNLELGLRVWMETYSTYLKVPKATSNWYPCKSLVHELGTDAFCNGKHKETMPAMNPSKICANALTDSLYA